MFGHSVAWGGIAVSVRGVLVIAGDAGVLDVQATRQKNNIPNTAALAILDAIIFFSKLQMPEIAIYWPRL